MTTKSETRGQNWIQRQFRGETKPSKHRCLLQSNRTNVPLQVRLREVASPIESKGTGTAYEIEIIFGLGSREGEGESEIAANYYAM